MWVLRVGARGASKSAGWMIVCLSTSTKQDEIIRVTDTASKYFADGGPGRIDESQQRIKAGTPVPASRASTFVLRCHNSEGHRRGGSFVFEH